jgi:Domain of unknown function (DUF4129)
MRFLSTLLLICAMFGCTTCARAQSNHVYEDSTILYPDEAVEEPAVMADQPASIPAPVADEEVFEESSYYKDTFIVSNRHFLSPDSIRLLKEDKQFLYAKNLDSLLVDLKKKEEERKRKEKNETESAPSDDISSTPSFIESLFGSKILQYVLWALAALFVVFVIYKLAFTEGGFKRTSADDRSNVKVLEEEDVTPVQGRNFDAAINKAKSENNYRLAVRYLYLQLLQRLTAAGAIEFAVDKTNTEYLRELTGKPYKETVAELTRYYDYVWYGEFEMDETLYTRVESKFKNLTV